MTRRGVPLVVLVALSVLAFACGGGEPDPVAQDQQAQDQQAQDQQAQDEQGGDEGPDSSTDSQSTDTAGSDEPGTPEPGSERDAEATGSSFEVTASVEQVAVTGARPGESLTLRGAGAELGAVADDSGNLIFRDVPTGDGYTVTGSVHGSEPFRVLAFEEHPEDSFYSSQVLDEGFGYIETRDGTLLSVMVRLPGPVEDGPYPTVVEYSGYTPSDPDEPQPAMGIAAQLGYATVGVNLRGTGCSGGAFDYFEPLQSLDGYDAIEVISRQAWVDGGRVGMVGLSYPGMTQLFVARLRPPGLAAIAPMSVIEDTYRSTLYPGGILNVGFAQSWAEERQQAAEPLGQDFARERVGAGDEICADNQLLRSQNPDLGAQIRANAFYDPAEADQLAPRIFVDQIDVPVFIAGQWQDEQTGSRFATMLDEFVGTDRLRIHLANGAHADGFGPTVLQRWAEFLDFYVGERIPVVPSALRAFAPAAYADAFGIDLELPADRFDGYSDFDTALAAYEAEEPVLLLLENGGDPDRLGGPAPRALLTFASWPPPEAEDATWYLGSGALSPEPTGPFTMSFRPEPSDGELVTPVGAIGDGFSDIDWPTAGPESSLSWTSDPLTEDTLLAGGGRVDLAIETGAEDGDIEITISEIRPDGTEVYVQSGWLRLSHATIDPSRTTATAPWHTHSASDAITVEGTIAVAVEIFPVAHPFRAGSRLRLSVDTPGGSRPEWKFDVLESTEPITVTSGSITMPLVFGLTFPPDYPACSPGLRGQPCRALS